MTNLFDGIEWNVVGLVAIHIKYPQTMALVRLFHTRKFGLVFPKLKRILLQLFFGVFKEEYKIQTISEKLHLNLHHLVHKM